ncbi:MAG: NAD(+)/NADH kinase [Aminobacteriaceae bacterium]
MKNPCIGMLVNTRKPGALEMTNTLTRWGNENGLQFLLPPHEASVVGVQGLSDEEWKEQVDIALVIGGDGTFLRAARYVLGSPVLLYGINLGRLGFLASGKADEALMDIESILKGEYSVQTHKVLDGKVSRDGHDTYSLYALNDLVLAKGALARVMHIEVHIGDKLLNTIPADGLIVSTPTGSTAYALSAGGPIVPPHVPCMIILPICAHTLYSRPVVVGEDDTITLIPRGNHRDLLLTQDGQLGYEILPGDRIDISLSRTHKIDVLTLPSRNYYDLLQEKLRWGQGIVTFEKE